MEGKTEDSAPASTHENSSSKKSDPRDVDQRKETTKLDDIQVFKKRDTDQEFGKHSASWNSILTQIVNTAFPDVPEEPKSENAAEYSKSFYNFKSIDRALEAYIESFYSNKYQYLQHHHAQKPIVNEAMIKLHYHMLAFIHLLRVRGQTRDQNYDITRTLAYLRDNLPAHMLKVDATMAPLFEMIADYSPEQEDCTDDVRVQAYIDFANHPITDRSQYLIEGDAKFVTPDFEGMIRMINRLLVGVNTEKLNPETHTAIWNLQDLGRNANEAQQVRGSVSHRNALFPLLPGQPYHHRDFLYGDARQIGFPVNNAQTDYYLRASRNMIRTIGFPAPRAAGQIDSLMKFMKIDEGTEFVLQNQFYVFDGMFSDGSNTLINCAMLQKSTLAWRIQESINHDAIYQHIKEQRIDIDSSVFDEDMKQREEIKKQAELILKSSVVHRQEDDQRRSAKEYDDCAARISFLFQKAIDACPKRPASYDSATVEEIVEHGYATNYDGRPFRDYIGEVIAEDVRERGVTRHWNNRVYVTPERSNQTQGLRELATYQVYMPPVGAHPGMRDATCANQGPFYDESHQPIRYQAFLKNEYGRYESAISGHFKTRA